MAIEFAKIIDTRVDNVNYDSVSEQILALASRSESEYICVANVHMVIEAHDDPDFRKVIDSAVLTTPDGMPLVWGLRLLGAKKAERVYGPTLAKVICQRACEAGIPIGFYGGTDEALRHISNNLLSQFPRLEIAYSFSPPFRPLSSEEDKKVS